MAKDAVRSPEFLKGRTPSPQEFVKVWPTPRAGKTTNENLETWMKRKERGGVATPPLSLAVQMWPTPRGQDSYERRNWKTIKRINEEGGDLTLPSAVKYRERMFPTPTAGDAKMSGAAGYSTESGRHSGTTLTDAVLRMWPTPKTPTGGGQMKRMTPGGGIRKLEDAVSKSEGRNTGALNPMWVEWLMGFPLGWTDLEHSGTP